jgi:hypothetical protein
MMLWRPLREPEIIQVDWQFQIDTTPFSGGANMIDVEDESEEEDGEIDPPMDDRPSYW